MMKKLGRIWSHIISAGFFLRELMKIVGGIWSHIFFRQILFEGAEDLEPYNFPPDSFSGS